MASLLNLTIVPIVPQSIFHYAPAFVEPATFAMYWVTCSVLLSTPFMFAAVIMFLENKTSCGFDVVFSDLLSVFHYRYWRGPNSDNLRTWPLYFLFAFMFLNIGYSLYLDFQVLAFMEYLEAVMVALIPVLPDPIRAGFVVFELLTFNFPFFFVSIIVWAAARLVSVRNLVSFVGSITSPPFDHWLFLPLNDLIRSLFNSQILFAILSICAHTVVPWSGLVIASISSPYSLMVYMTYALSDVLVHIGPFRYLLVYYLHLYVRSNIRIRANMIPLSFFFGVLGAYETGAVLLLSEIPDLYNSSFMLFHPWWWLLSRTWFPLAQQRYQFVFGLAGLWFFRWPILSLAITWPFLVSIALINVYYCRYYKGSIEISYPEFLRTVGGGAVRMSANPQWYSVAQLQDFFPIRDGCYSWWPHQRFHTWGKEEVEKEEFGMMYHDEESTVSPYAEYAVPGLAGWKDSRFKFETGSPDILECNSLSSRFVRPKKQRVITLQHQDFGDFKEAFLSTIPNLRAFVEQHPVASVVLTSTWMTRSYYACQHILGFVATIVELAILFSLSIDQKVVEGCANLFMKSVSKLDPRIDPDLEHQDDSPSAAYQIANGALELASAAIGLGSSADFHKRLVVSQLAANRFKDVVGFITFAMKLIKAVHYFCKWYVFGPSRSDRIGLLVQQFAISSGQFALVDMQRMDQFKAKELIELYETGIGLRAHAMQWPDEIRKEYLHSLDRVLHEAKQIYDQLLDIVRYSSPRPEPVVMTFQGNPAVMKSCLTSLLAKAAILHLNNGVYDPSLKYPLNPVLKHFDGYRPNALVVVNDDYHQFKDAESLVSASQFMIRAVNHEEFILPMANVNLKGLKFRARAILLSTNVDIMKLYGKGPDVSTLEHVGANATVPVSSTNAYGRRHQNVYTVEIKDEGRAKILAARSADDLSLADIESAYSIRYVGKEVRKGNDAYLGGVQGKPVVSVESLVMKLIQEIDERQARKDGIDAALLKVADSIVGKNKGGEVNEDVLEKMERFMSTQSFSDKLKTLKDFDIGSLLSRLGNKIESEANSVLDSIRPNPDFSFSDPPVEQSAAGVLFEDEAPPNLEHQSRTRRYDEIDPRVLTKKQRRRLRAAKRHNARKRATEQVRVPKFMNNPLYQDLEHQAGPIDSFLSNEAYAEQYEYIIQNWNVFTEDLDGWYYARLLDFAEICRDAYILTRGFDPYPEFWQIDAADIDWRDSDETDEETAEQRWFDMQDAIERGDYDLEHQMWQSPKTRKTWFFRFRLVRFIKNMLYPIMAPFYHAVAGFFNGIVVSVTLIRGFYGLVTSDKMRKKALILSVSAVTVLLLVLLGFLIFKSPNSEHQSVDKRRVEPKKPKPIQLTARNIQEFSKPNMEHQAVKFDQNLGEMLLTNITTAFGVITINGPYASRSHIQCIGHGLAIVAAHAWHRVEETQCSVSIYLPKKTKVFEYGEIRPMYTDPDADIMIIYHPYFLVKAMDKYYLDLDEIVSCVQNGTPAYMLKMSNLSDKGVPTEVPISNLRFANRYLSGPILDYGIPFIEGDTPTEPGDCISLLFFRDPTLKSGRFAGFLFGGSVRKGEGQTCYFCPFSKQDCQAVYSGFMENQSDEFRGCEDVPRKKRLSLDQIPNGVRFHGYTRHPVHASTKQGIVESEIAEDLLEEGFIPKTAPTTCTDDMKGFEYGLSKWSRPKPHVSLSWIKEKLGDVWQEWPAPYQKEILSFDEAIKGRGDIYMDPIRQASGPGYSYVSQGGKFPWLFVEGDDRKASEMLRDRISSTISAAASQSGFSPAAEYQKNERVSKPKYSNRMISAGQIDAQIVMRSLFAPWLDSRRRMCPTGPSMVGFNPWSIHWHMMELKGAHKNIIAGDISGYDISVLSTLIMFWGEQVLKWFSAHVNDGLNWLRFWYILHTVIWHLHAVLFYWFGRDGVNSGNIITVEINDAINMMITQIAAITILEDDYSRDEVLEMFRDGTINCFFYGDDSRIYVADRISDKFNNITYAQALKDLFGMTVTPSHDKNAPLSKWPSPEETVFLRRRTVRLGGLRFGAFSVPECYEIAYWCTTKGDKKTMTRDNCEAALRELGFHGPKVYQKAWNTFSRGLAKRKCPPLRVNYDQWWASVFGTVPSGQYEVHVPTSIAAESDLPVFEQSSPPKPGLLLREEEEGPQALERGVRLLQNKGFPVDVQLVLARLSEKQTCYCLPSKVKEQPKLFSLTSRTLTQFCTPMSEFEKFTDLMTRTINHKTYGELHQLEHQSELREPQDNPISTPQQTQTVVDQIKDTYEQFGLPPSYYQLCDMDPLPDHGQKEVLSRPYEVYNATWQASAPAGTLMKELGFPGALFAIPQIIEKLRWFTYFRCKGIKLTVRLNLTPFHFGCLMLSNVEGQSSYGAAVHDATFAQRLNNRPIFLTAMGSPPVEIFYPWTLPMQWLPWKLIVASTFSSAPGNFSLSDIIQRVCLDVVQPLQTLGAANTAGSITIFANFVDPEVQGPCLSTEPFPEPPQLEHQSEEVRKVEDGVFTALGTAENSVKSVMEIVESVGNISAFASSFDKPMLKTIEQKIVFDNQTDSSYVRGGVVGQKLTATPEATLADHTMMKGNLTIKNIIETPGAIDLFAIEGGTHVAGDLVESWTVHPCFSRNTTTWGTGTAVVPTYYGYVASLFKWWRGGINYQFRFFCPKFATMRGRFVWFPPDCGVASMPPSTLAAADTGNLYSQVFDITGDTIVSILIPWLSPLVYRQVQPTVPGTETTNISLGNVPGGPLTYPTMGNSNGTLALYMVNDISAPASETPINITAVVYASADFDSQLGFYAGTDQTLNIDWGFREPPSPNLEHQSGSVWGNAVSHEYVAPAPDSQTRAKKPVPIATKKASNTLDAAATAITGRLDRNFVMPEDLTNMALVDLLKRFVYPGGVTFWNAYMHPLGFTGLYQYISLLFVWARGSFVIRFTDDSTPANAFVSQDDLNRTTGQPHTQGIQNHVMKTVQIYPQVPFPYWPVAADLRQPVPSSITKASQYWGPLTWTYSTGAASWIADVGSANGGFCGSVGDDFGLFQMYSPPLIVVPAADDVVINAASDKIPRTPDLSLSTPPPTPRRPLSGSDENLGGLSSPTRSVQRVGGSWRIFSKK